MTNKDYEAIANIINNNREFDPYVLQEFKWHEFVRDCCNYFEQDNPNFDREKFLEACGL